MPVSPRRGSGRTQWQWQLPSWSPFWHCQSQSTLPAANFQLPASEPKANNAYNDNNNKKNNNNDNGKWGKWQRRFREALALPFAFALVFVFAFISISLGACFHFGFTFDLTVVRASVATVRLDWLRFVSVCLFGSISSYDLTLGKAKDTQIFMRGAKTMRMPCRNSTAHLQMNRLMSAGTPLPTLYANIPAPFPFALPCLCGKVQATHKLTLNMSI